MNIDPYKIIIQLQIILEIALFSKLGHFKAITVIILLWCVIFYELWLPLHTHAC